MPNQIHNGAGNIAESLLLNPETLFLGTSFVGRAKWCTDWSVAFFSENFVPHTDVPVKFSDI